MASKAQGISFDKKTLEAAKKAAKKERRSLSSFIRETILFWVEKHNDKSDTKPNNS